MKRMRRILSTLMAVLIIVGVSAAPVLAAENATTFNYKAYADTYADLKAAYGYDATALYNHYVKYGKAEGRVATFNDAGTATTAAATTTQVGTETMDPEPPQDIRKQADWFGKLTPPETMTNARLVAEDNRLNAWMRANYYSDSTQIREENLYIELGGRANALYELAEYQEEFDDDYNNIAHDMAAEIMSSDFYKRALMSDTAPLSLYMG